MNEYLKSFEVKYKDENGLTNERLSISFPKGSFNDINKKIIPKKF